MSLLDIFRSPEPVSVVEREEPVVEALPAVQNASDGGRILSNIEELSEAFGVVGSLAGPVVNPRTSMRVAAVYACTRLIAGAIASLPCPVYRRTSDGGRERDPNHELSPLLNLQPTPLMSAAMFWEYITSAMLLHGDGYALILRNGFGEVEELLPFSPLDVMPERRGNELVYFLRLHNGDYIGVDQGQMLHFTGFGFNGERSLSVVKHAACNSIGLAMAMEQFSSEFFSSGAHQDVAITYRGKKLTEDQKQDVRESWVKTYSGAGKRKYPLVFGSDVELKELSINADDSQLLESRRFQIAEIARAFGLPPFLIGETEKSTSWGSGLAEQGLAFVRYALMPHLNRFQQEINRKFFLRGDRFLEFVLEGLLRGTTKERYEAYKTALGGSNVPGWMTPNEVRRLENRDPLPDRNETYWPPAGNNQTPPGDSNAA